MSKVFLLVVLGVLIVTGCSTVGQTTLLGAGLGAAAGTAIGLASSKTVGSAAVGSGIGAALGSGLFYLGAQDEAKKDDILKATIQGKLRKDQQVPMLTVPEVVCHLVDGKFEDSGTKWVGPHQSCEIKRQSVFTK